MCLAPGARLGPYEIVAAIGAGGMGEVYQARDPRLGRDVAVKILPESFSDDDDRLRRFEQEARAAAALNHPNILAVFDIGTHDGAPYVVAELLEGETLRERLSRSALPARKAVEAAVQVARGLAAAHEKGIVHRDLKPENIFITQDGRTKILDFGLAKLVESEHRPSSITNVPTTPRFETQPGLVLGTMGYIAPEQLRGQAVDHRADIFALGVILYEMLCGRRAFSRETAVDTMTAILKEDPEDLPLAERHIPPAVARIVDRCLEKTPGARFQSASDLAFALDAVSSQSDVVPRSIPVERRLPRRLPWAIAIVMTFVSAIALALAFGRGEPDQPRVRFFISPPDGWSLPSRAIATGSAPFPLAVSPDGRRLAFTAIGPDGRDQLWIRPLDTLLAAALPGTDGASSPFWSPDSQLLGFFADGKVKTIDVSGGQPVTVFDGQAGRGGAWSRDGVIVFGSLINGPLQKVSAAGGVPAPATSLASGETVHMRPTFLSDGRHFLYTSGRAVFVASLDSIDTKLILNESDSSTAVYAQGYLLFIRGTTLMAQAFDERGLTLAGQAAPVADQLEATISGGIFSTSLTNSVLAYWNGETTGDRTSLVWMDRTGKRLATAAESGEYWNIALSPDERRVAVSMLAGTPRSRNLWIIDLPRLVSSQITFPPQSGSVPTWSPDGKRIAFSGGGAPAALYQKAADGGERTELFKPTWLIQSGGVDWSHDGRSIVYSGFAKETRWDLWIVAADGSGKAVPFLQTRFDEDHGAFSPDVKWIAYSSNESGRQEIYVQPFPATGAKYRISRAGGIQPLWRGDGKELFFLAPDSTLMAAPLTLIWASNLVSRCRYFPQVFKFQRRRLLPIARLTTICTGQGGDTRSLTTESDF
jgi:serine/threonine protein kinase